MLSAFQQLTPEHLGALVPKLADPLVHVPSVEGASNEAPTQLASQGWFEIPAVIDQERRAVLVDAVERLLSAGLPAVGVYAFDEPWRLGARIRDRVSHMLGCRYVLVEDVWAFLIRPGSSGWSPHRGVVSAVLDRARPEYLNVWIALTDAGTDRSCMNFVALDADPSYPEDLGAAIIPTAAQAAPVAAGTALVWNANTLHWGGRCDALAPGPRISATFSLCRADAAEGTELNHVANLDPERLTPWARIDILARQIAIYGNDQPDVSDDVRNWASTTSAISTRMAAKAPRKER